MPAQTAQSGDSVRDLLEKILENQAAFIDGGGGGGGSVASTDVQFAATNRILGRITGGAGAGEELTAAEVLTLTGAAAGPASSTDNAIVRYDSTTGKLLQNSGVTVGDVGSNNVTITPITDTALTLATLDNNRNITLSPHGSGQVSIAGANGLAASGVGDSSGAGGRAIRFVGGEGHIHVNPSFPSSIIALAYRAFIGTSPSATSAKSASMVIPASPEAITLGVLGGTVTDSATAGSGTSTAALFSSFTRPTLAATNASVTTTDAATVYIENAPVAGTNMTITRAHALWINAGSFRLDGTTGAGAGAGTLANAPSAGDPDKWIPINSDGVQYWFPAWSA